MASSSAHSPAVSRPTQSPSDSCFNSSMSASLMMRRAVELHINFEVTTNGPRCNPWLLSDERVFKDASKHSGHSTLYTAFWDAHTRTFRTKRHLLCSRKLDMAIENMKVSSNKYIVSRYVNVLFVTSHFQPPPKAGPDFSDMRFLVAGCLRRPRCAATHFCLPDLERDLSL